MRRTPLFGSGIKNGGFQLVVCVALGFVVAAIILKPHCRNHGWQSAKQATRTRRLGNPSAELHKYTLPAIQEDEDVLPKRGQSTEIDAPVSAATNRRRQRVVVLVGPHKTGCSSIQYNMDAWSKSQKLGNWVWPLDGEKSFAKLSGELHMVARGEDYARWERDSCKAKFQELWTGGKNIVFGSEGLDHVPIRSDELFQGKTFDGARIIDELIQLMPWEDATSADLPNLDGSLDDMTVAVTYRMPRVDQLISLWHLVGNYRPGISLSEYLELVYFHDHARYILNPLGVAKEFVDRGIHTVILDTSGIASSGLDISAVVACEVLNVPCHANGSIVGLEDEGRPTVRNKGEARGDLDLNDEQLDRIDAALRRFDCTYYEHLAGNPGVEMLHKQDLFADCGDDTGEHHHGGISEMVQTIQDIAREQTGPQSDRRALRA